MFASLSSLALLALAPGAHAGPAQEEAVPPATLFVRAQRLIVRPGEELQDVAVLVQRGRIVAIGPGLEPPEDARVVEGAVVCAGLVDPWASVGVDPGSVRDLRTGPATRAADALDPWDFADERAEALRGGVTSARVQAGLKAEVGGFGALVRVNAGPDDEPLVDDACMGATIGVTRDRNEAMDVFERVGEVDKLVGQLERGLRYRDSWLDYEEELAEWEKAIAEKTEELEKDFKKAKKKREKEMEEAEEKDKKFKEERYKEDRKPREPRYDEDSEALARVANGEVPLVVEVHRAEEIRNLLEKTERFSRLRLVLVGATEAGHQAAALARREVPVVLWPTPMGDGRADEWDEHDLALAGRLERAGVRVLIGSGGERNVRDLRLLAALAVGHGLDREAAFDAITLAPASVFDVSDRIGSVEQGKEADLLVLDGDPLESTTRVQQVISKGRLWSE